MHVYTYIAEWMYVYIQHILCTHVYTNLYNIQL